MTAAEALKRAIDETFPLLGDFDDGYGRILAALRAAGWSVVPVENAPKERPPLSQEPYGSCPLCGGKGVMRERRPDGDTKCENGHFTKSALWR